MSRRSSEPSPARPISPPASSKPVSPKTSAPAPKSPASSQPSSMPIGNLPRSSSSPGRAPATSPPTPAPTASPSCPPNTLRSPPARRFASYCASMAAVTTLFTRDQPPARLESTGLLVVVYAFTSFIWLALAIGNFRDPHHAGRGWAQAVAGILFLVSFAIHLTRWLKNRRAA